MDAAAPFQGDAHHRLLRTRRPQVDGVDRIVVRCGAHQGNGDIHILLTACLASYLCQDVIGKSLGVLQSRPIGRPHTKLKLPGIHLGEDFDAQSRVVDPPPNKQSRRYSQVEGYQDPPSAHDAA
jgi:hypothetical protein